MLKMFIVVEVCYILQFNNGCYCLQQNMSLLEDEQKTMVQLGIEDNSQLLIEGIFPHPAVFIVTVLRTRL